jgi:hypothetical protein
MKAGVAVAIWMAAAQGCGAQPPGRAVSISFEYAEHAGFGETPIRLTIEGTEATLVRQQSQAEAQAIGVFHAPVSSEQIRRLNAATPDALRSAVSMPPDSPNFTVRLRAGTRNVNLRIAAHPEALTEVEALTNDVNKLIAELPWKAERALWLELMPPAVAVTAGKPVEFVVRLHNPGTQALSLPLKAGAITIQAMAAVAPPRVPGVTPRPRFWETAGGDRTLPASVTVPAGATADIKLQATIDEAKSTLVRANFEMRRGADAFGAAFSKALTINVK